VVNWKGFERKSCGLSELRARYFSEEAKENHYKQQAGYQVFRLR